MAAPQIVALAATTETILNRTPFLPQQPAQFNSVPGATVYGVNLSSKNALLGTYQHWRGDGSTVAWTNANIINLAKAHYDSGSLAAADVLKVVVLVDGSPLHRVASGASPSAGQFKTSESGGVVTMTFGSTYTSANKIEVFLQDTVTTIATLTANVPTEAASYQVVYASAATQVIRIAG